MKPHFVGFVDFIPEIDLDFGFEIGLDTGLEIEPVLVPRQS